MRANVQNSITQLGRAFIEVRVRRGGKYGTPEESLTPRKRDHLFAAANAYLEQFPQYADCAWRVDLVAIELDARGRLIRTELIKNAVEGRAGRTPILRLQILQAQGRATQASPLPNPRDSFLKPAERVWFVAKRGVSCSLCERLPPWAAPHRSVFFDISQAPAILAFVR